MAKAVELKHQTTELPASATPATQNLTKARNSAKWKEWNCGKKPTEKRLPCYLNQDTYIPKFQEMTFETLELLKTLHDYSESTPATKRK